VQDVLNGWGSVGQVTDCSARAVPVPVQHRSRGSYGLHARTDRSVHRKKGWTLAEERSCRDAPGTGVGPRVGRRAREWPPVDALRIRAGRGSPVSRNCGAECATSPKEPAVGAMDGASAVLTVALRPGDIARVDPQVNRARSLRALGH